MAPKKQTRLFEDPPSASPSQDHGEEDEEELEEPHVEDSEEEDYEEEEENELAQDTQQVSKFSQLSQIQPGYESSEEEEGSETDDDKTKSASPNASNFIIKPAANKNNGSVEPSKPTTKRVLIDSEGRKDSAKKTKVTKDRSAKDRDRTTVISGSSGGRVWTPSDVIAVLEGMIEYQKKRGLDPQADMAVFLEFVKGRFGFEVTKSQLYEKIRNLKKKFFTTVEKGEKYIPTKPHDLECFELSKKIWGENNVDGVVGNGVSAPNDRVVGNGVDHTENVKNVDGVSLTKKSAKSKGSEGKLKEKGDKKKRESDKKNKKKKKDYVPNIVEKIAEPVSIVENEAEPVTIVEKEAEPVTIVEKEAEPVTIVEKETEPVSDEDLIMKDKEDVVKDNEKGLNNYENVVKDNEQNIPLKYPNLIASLSIDMPESRRKLMMEGISLVDSEKARELDNSWKELQIKEAEFYCRKLELMAEQSRLVMDALKK